MIDSYNPHSETAAAYRAEQVWAVPVSLATTQGIVSFPPATEMFQFAGLPLAGLWIQPAVTGHYPDRVSPFGNPWISTCSGSPRHIVACHVLHRLLAPRHPPRALCSLTSLDSSPRGKCERVRDHTLSLSSAETEVLRVSSDHIFTWKGAGSLRAVGPGPCRKRNQRSAGPRP